MAKSSRYRKFSKVFNTPRRSYQKSRFEAELQLCGKYGLANKREIYRARFMLAKIRKTARTLLTLSEKDTIRIFQGDALLRRLHALGILSPNMNQLDYVLGLKIDDILKRRLQTIYHTSGQSPSIHQARTAIRQGHVAVGSQVVTVPSYLVRVSSEKLVCPAHNSVLNPKNADRKGRIAKIKARSN